MSQPDSLVSTIAKLQNRQRFQDLHWEGSFEEYLEIVRKDGRVARSAFQRVYDMVLSYGRSEYIDSKKKVVHYPFFDDPVDNGRDAIFGLDIPLMRLVNVLKSAAMAYGTEKRVILLHGPVGSSKSTIARLLKKGLEAYSQTDDGRLFTFEWHVPKELQQVTGGHDVFSDPMNEDPLKLIPLDMRHEAIKSVGL